MKRYRTRLFVKGFGCRLAYAGSLGVLLGEAIRPLILIVAAQSAKAFRSLGSAERAG